MDLTIVGVGREVRHKIENGMRPTEAAEAVAREFVGEENGKLRAMLDSGFLAFAFREAESRTLRSDKLYAGGGDLGHGDTLSSSEAPTRTRYDAFFAKPWDVKVPVANTGDRKRLGDFTESDCLAVRNLYRSTAETARAKAALWARVAKKVGPDRTLEQAWNELAEDDRKMLS